MDIPKENELRAATAFDLIPLQDLSAADIVAELADFDTARWLSRAPFPYSVADARAYQAACGDEVRAIVFAGKFAGIIGLKPELCFWVAKPFWGQGLATAAGQQLLADHFFASDALIVSGHLIGSRPSARVLAKLGFRYTHEETVTPISIGVETVVERMALDRAGWWAAQRLPIVTKRLSLRPLRPTDAPALARIGDLRVARMFKSIGYPWSEAALAGWIELARWTGRPDYRLAICLPNGALIGTVGFGGDPLEVGYFLAEDQTGHGYAQEACHAVLADAFARFGMRAVVAEHFEDNPASGHVLRKLGFAEVGRGQSQSGARPVPAPAVFYRLERADFPGLCVTAFAPCLEVGRIIG